MKKFLAAFLVLGLLVSAGASVASAGVPAYVNQQGQAAGNG